MSSRDLRQDIGRLVWIGFEGTSVSDALRDTLEAGDAGGVILFARNVPRTGEETDLEALRALTRELHQAGHKSGERLLISVDQEGGSTQRIKAPAAAYPPMLAAYPGTGAASLDALENLGMQMGSELLDWGFDVNLAPVLDVHTNPKNPVIGDRAFATDPHDAATRALAFARGLSEAGIISCGKHFPGHGDTDLDSHLDLPRLHHDMQRIREVELIPFARAVDAGLPMLMTAHVVFSAIDDSVPATLSRAVISELLRKELGYQGVVITDDLDMLAIADNFGVGQAAVRAIEAGCDVVLVCHDLAHQDDVREALSERATDDPAFRARVVESAARVRRLGTRQRAA